MLSDIEISKKAKLKNISEIAEQAGINQDEVIQYGRDKAKISLSLLGRLSQRKDARLVLVTAVNPTPLGEGKTTVTIGLGQALCRLGKKAIVAVREPSLGPVFGVKGGAAGGGYSQAVPMDDINLHFTGDIHAVTAANNLLCAAIDNHIYQGNALNIDVSNVVFRRVMDMNDRALRRICIGLGGSTGGVPREDSFSITVASEVMAILCLSESISDLRERLGNIICAYNRNGEPVYARDLKVSGAMAVLLKDAIMPNLVQTLENTPCFIHGGPFANIAHGCNSIIATKMALSLGEYVLTEAGFGADLGAEKFFDIKCRLSGLIPSAVVVVATVKSVKYNGGCPLENIKFEDMSALSMGICNLEKHIINMKKFGVPVVVCLNRFSSDTDAEIDFIREFCRKSGADFAVCEVFAHGGEGGKELAQKVMYACNSENSFRFLYDESLGIKEKVSVICREIYGADGVSYSTEAEKSISKIEELGLYKKPVCIAKTPYSFSDNPNLLGKPQGFTVNVNDVSVSNGAGFIVARAGNIMTMPGLSASPSAERIDILPDGTPVGIF